LQDLKRLSDQQLAHISGAWKPGTWHHSFAEEELKRRRPPAKKTRLPLFALMATCLALLLVTIVLI
jgi:hypothetical protein